jgi:hypothetical protein
MRTEVPRDEVTEATDFAIQNFILVPEPKRRFGTNLSKLLIEIIF